MLDLVGEWSVVRFPLYCVAGVRSPIACWRLGRRSLRRADCSRDVGLRTSRRSFLMALTSWSC